MLSVLDVVVEEIARLSLATQLSYYSATFHCNLRKSNSVLRTKCNDMPLHFSEHLIRTNVDKVWSPCTRTYPRSWIKKTSFSVRGESSRIATPKVLRFHNHGPMSASYFNGAEQRPVKWLHVNSIPIQTLVSLLLVNLIISSSSHACDLFLGVTLWENGQDWRPERGHVTHSVQLWDFRPISFVITKIFPCSNRE